MINMKIRIVLILNFLVLCMFSCREDDITETTTQIGPVPTIEYQRDIQGMVVDENGSAIQIPAELEAGEIAKIQAIAIKTYKTLCCEGLARVDVFLTPKGEIYVNEINTLPGFTSISMYPKLWEASGKSYSDLLTELISLAINRSEQEQKLLTSL